MTDIKKKIGLIVLQDLLFSIFASGILWTDSLNLRWLAESFIKGILVQKPELLPEIEPGNSWTQRHDASQ